MTRWLLAALLATHPALACGTGPVPCVMDGHAFVDSVGVVTHFVDPSTPYAAHAGGLLQRLLAARLRHIRDAAISQDGGVSSGDQAALFRTLGQAGIRVDYVTNFGLQPTFLRDFAARVAPSAELFELPNEANDGHRPNWAADLRATIPGLRAQAGGIPLIGPALILLSAGQPGDNAYAVLGDQSAKLDFGNVHDYPAGFAPGTPGWGNQAAPPCQGQRYGSIGFSLCSAAATSGTKPVMATEYGWSTAAHVHGAVPEAIQARYVLRGLLLHAAQGVARTYLYQLVDAGSDAGAAMGLLHADLSPKPAYAALAALLTLADDTGPGRPAPPIQLTGNLADVWSVLLRRAHGPSRLAVWLERPGFDPNADGGVGSLIPVPPQTIHVQVASPARLTALRTLTDAGTAVARPLDGGTGLDLLVTDRVTLIDIDDGAIPGPG